MFATTSVQEFFPTPIWIVDLQAGFADVLNDRLLAQFERLSGSRPTAGVGSTWQTDPDLHKRPEFAELNGLLHKSVKACLDFLEVDYADFVITGCWANFNPTGGLNSAHTHPNNYLSGVYYLRTPTGADTIEFTDPRPAAVACMPRAKQLNRFNGNRMTVQAKPGQLRAVSSVAVAQRPGQPHQPGAREHRLQRDVRELRRDHGRSSVEGHPSPEVIAARRANLGSVEELERIDRPPRDMDLVVQMRAGRRPSRLD